MKTLKNAKLVKSWTAKFLHTAFFQKRHAFFLRIHLSWTTSCPSAGVQHHCLHDHPPAQARLVKATGGHTVARDAGHRLVQLPEIHLAQGLGS